MGSSLPICWFVHGFYDLTSAINRTSATFSISNRHRTKMTHLRFISHFRTKTTTLFVLQGNVFIARSASRVKFYLFQRFRRNIRLIPSRHFRLLFQPNHRINVLCTSSGRQRRDALFQDPSNGADKKRGGSRCIFFLAKEGRTSGHVRTWYANITRPSTNLCSQYVVRITSPLRLFFQSRERRNKRYVDADNYSCPFHGGNLFTINYQVNDRPFIYAETSHSINNQGYSTNQASYPNRHANRFIRSSNN